MLQKKWLGKRGYGYVATQYIPKNTIILIEKPLIWLDNIREDNIFELLSVIVSDKKIYNKFVKLSPQTLYSDSKFNNIWQRYLNLSEPKTKESLTHFSENELKLLYLKVINNAFTFSDNRNGQKPCILMQGAIFNHSCYPNIIFYKKDDTIIFQTIRDVRSQEELTDSYIDITLPTALRQTELLKRYNFKCDCLRCQRDTMSKKDISYIEKQRRNISGY